MKCSFLDGSKNLVFSIKKAQNPSDLDKLHQTNLSPTHALHIQKSHTLAECRARGKQPPHILESSKLTAWKSMYLLAAVESLTFFPSNEAKCCSRASRRLLGAWRYGNISLQASTHTHTHRDHKYTHTTYSGDLFN